MKPVNYAVTPGVEGRLPSSVPTAVTVLSGQSVEVGLGLDGGMRQV